MNAKSAAASACQQPEAMADGSGTFDLTGEVAC